MKKILFASFAVVVAVALVSFTNAEKKSSKFDCTWFIYNKLGQAYPTSATEAKVRTDYRQLVTGEDINSLCPETHQLCAICVNSSSLVNGVLRPIIVGDPVESNINAYFTGTGNKPLVVDFPGSIAEKQN